MPGSPIGPVPPLPFDTAASHALSAALDGLAWALAAAVRADAGRVGAATVDWRGFTRSWFGQRHAAATDSLRAAARLASQAAEDVRRAEALALATQRRQIVEAERAAAVELARLVALAEAG